MEIKIKKKNGQYGIQLNQDNQYFDLEYCATKKECEWYVEMLKKAFTSYEKEIIKNWQNIIKESMGID